MSASSPVPKKQKPTTRPISGPMIIFATALDTTWRIFAPILVGTFLGIWLDDLLNITPIAVIVCLIVGTILSGVLITQQVLSVRK